MHSFKQFISEKELTPIEKEILEYIENYNSDIYLSEGVFDKLKSKLGSIVSKIESLGLKFEKMDKGLIGSAIQSGQSIGKAVTLLIAYNKAKKNNDSESQSVIKQQWKQQVGKQVNKKDLAAFLYNLDMLSMHLITGPLHMFKALTGYELEFFKHAKEGGAIDAIKNHLSSIKDKIKNIFDKKKASKIKDKIETVETDIDKYFSGQN